MASPAASPRQASAPSSPVPAAVNTASPLPTPPVSPVRTPVAQAALPPTPPREVHEEVQEVPAAVEEEEEEEELSLGDLDNEVC